MAREVVLLAALSLTLTLVQGQSMDMTLTPETKGAAVVNAVVDKIHARCIFNNDRLFMRRLAYVESEDGNDPKTYRQGFNGGIWQVDQSMLDATKSCAAIIKHECDVIKAEFGIDWTTVTWDQLRTPLYSGLAAALYLLQRLGNSHSIPGDVTGQADLWSHYYHLGEPEGTFIDLAAKATRFDCNGKMDLAFVMDSSGSIMASDYLLQLNFVADVVDSLPVSRDQVQIANTVFGTDAKVSFHFDTYNDKQDIINDIRKTPKDNGGTNTPDALKVTRKEVFDATNGARHDARKVAVLVTDGESYDFNLTVQEAQRLRADGVVVFAIGVGWINLQELRAVASEPVCSHVYVLDNYAHIESILYEIQKSTCEAPLVVTTNNTITGHVGENGTTISMGTVKPDNNSVLAIRSNCSILDVYVSYTNPNPNPALYAEKFTSEHGKPAFLSMTSHKDGLPVYITVVGTRLPNSSADVYNCSDFTYTVEYENRTQVEVVCREKHTFRDCNPQDFIGTKYENMLCKDNTMEPATDNPCTSENLNKSRLIHPHPTNSQLFIKCDLLGRMYITKCPNNEDFNKDTLACGFEQGVTGDKVPLPDTYPNPCTPAVISSGLYFFPYTFDKHRYIQCDVWGQAWLRTCYPQHVWNDPAHTCVPDTLHEFDSTTVAPFHVQNPCTPEALAAGSMFFPHPCDHDKYIHCDIAGNYYIQSCPAGQYFEPSASVCTPADTQPINPDCRK